MLASPLEEPAIQRLRTTLDASYRESNYCPAEQHWLFTLIQKANSQIGQNPKRKWGVKWPTIASWAGRSSNWLPQPNSLFAIIESVGFTHLSASEQKRLWVAYIYRSLDSVFAGNDLTLEMVDAIKELTKRSPEFVFHNLTTTS